MPSPRHFYGVYAGRSEAKLASNTKRSIGQKSTVVVPFLHSDEVLLDSVPGILPIYNVLEAGFASERLMCSGWATTQRGTMMRFERYCMPTSGR